MKKLLVSIAVVLFLVCAADAVQPKISPDRINTSRPFPSILMDEDANITLDGGFIYNLQGAGFYNPCAYGAIPGDGIDDAPYIEEAREAAIANGGGTIFIPGMLEVNSSQVNHPGSPVIPDNTSFFMPANFTNWVGIPGVSGLRVMDNYRTAWRGATMIGDFDLGHFTHDWGVYGMTFDMNGQNNLITDHSMTNGDAAIYGAAVHIQTGANITIEQVRVYNTTGFNCLVFGGRGYPGYEDIQRYSENIHIRNCEFEVMGNEISGNNISDFTTIYLWAPNSSVENCRIIGGIMSEFDMCGIELHSANSIARNNVIFNLTNGIYLATDAGDGIEAGYWRAIGNEIQCDQKGITCCGGTNKFDEIEIADNKIRMFVNNIYHEGFGIGHGLGASTWNPALQEPTNMLNIHDNTVDCIYSNESSASIYAVYINESNNTFVNRNVIRNVSSDGICILNYRTSNISATGNLIDGFGTRTGDSYECSGIYIFSDGNLKHGEFVDNIIRYETQTARANNAIGVRVLGTGTKNVTIRNEVSPTCWLPEYIGEPADAYSTLHVEASGTSAPTYGAHSKGCIYWNTNPLAGGPAFWVTTTAGKPGTMTPCKLST